MIRHASATSRRICAGSFAVLVLTAALVGALGCGSSETASTAAATATPSTPPARAGGPAERPPIERLQPRQRAHFALFRTPPEPLPAATRRIMRRPTFGMNWSLAQRIPVALAGAYWLVPGDGHLCVVTQDVAGVEGVGSVCARTAQTIRHGIANVTVHRGTAATGGRPARLTVGVAPDGARGVRVHTRGAVSAAPVVDHLFVVRDATDRPPDSIELVPG